MRVNGNDTYCAFYSFDYVQTMEYRRFQKEGVKRAIMVLSLPAGEIRTPLEQMVHGTSAFEPAELEAGSLKVVICDY